MLSAKSTPTHIGSPGVHTPESASKRGLSLIDKVQKLLFQDEPAVATTTSSSGSYKIDHNKPRASYSAPFHHGRMSARSSNDSPFNTPTKLKIKSEENTTATHFSGKKRELNNDWRARSASQDSKEANGAVKTADEGNSTSSAYAPGAESESPQALFQPECCVFVANLLNTESDESLEASVTNVFRDFGTVFVKVRRDGKNMPFAFAQFTTIEHAERAIVEGHGRFINGRPCRCERTKAYRTFVVQRRDGHRAHAVTANTIFGSFGPLNECRELTAAERAILRTGAPGVIIQYSMYAHGQMAYKAYKHDNVYRITPLTEMGDNHTRGAYSYPDRTGPTAQSYLKEYDIERRSIFVGGLSTQSELDLRRLFDQFGPINDIQILHKISEYNNEIITWAFIEFKDVRSPAEAIHRMHGYRWSIRDKTIVLRVFRKDSKNRLRVRPESSNSVPTSGPAATAYLFGPSPATAVGGINGPYPVQGLATNALNAFNNYSPPFGFYWSPEYGRYAPAGYFPSHYPAMNFVATPTGQAHVAGPPA